MRNRLTALLRAAALLALPAAPAAAADSGPVNFELITDMSGTSAALSGAGALEATKMAIEDFGGSVLGRHIEVTATDHRNNASDAARTRMGQWQPGNNGPTTLAIGFGCRGARSADPTADGRSA